jgi:parallel beta-helix repeat protein
VQRNGAEGILFRDELPAMAANRNRVIDNTVEDNGEAGIRVRGVTSGNEIRDNTVRDTRTGADRRQTTDIVVEPSAVGNVVEGNTNE